jgi:hypothetical protein
MKQIWPNYSYSPTTNVLTLTGLNIDRDQLLLVSAPERGRIMYNFADSTVTASAFTAGVNTGLTLVASTAGLTTTAAFVIYYDDQAIGISVTVTTVSIENFPASQATTFGAVTGSVSVLNFPASQAVTFTDASLTNTQLRASAVTIGGTVTASISGTVPVSGTFFQTTQPVSLATLPTLAAGTAQIGSVTASISGTIPVSGTFFQTTQPVSLATVPTHGVTLASTTVTVSSLPALVAGTAQIGSVTASISGTVTAMAGTNFSTAIYQGILTYAGNEGGDGAVALYVNVGNLYGALPAGTNRIGVVTIGAGTVTIGAGTAQIGTVTANTFAVQGTAVTTSNFTSTTASTVLASFNAAREVLTIFNEGAGNLHICAGATCTTIGYQVRLAAGDYYEVPNHQTTITHSAVFATAGTARVTQVS